MGETGTGIFVQWGGANTINGNLCLGYGSGSSGTYNLNGGLLILPLLSQGLGSAAFNFSGGTLQANGGFSTTVPMTLGTSGGGATFNTAGYTVTLSGSLSGPGSLTLNDTSGTGTLILATSNTYIGGTTVTAGTLQLGDGVANNGYVQGNILNNGEVAFANPAGQTYAGMISGSGGLTKVGMGTLTLTAANTYTGNTTMNAGTLNAGAAENPGVSGPFGTQAANAAGSILFGGGTLQYSIANQFDYSGRFSSSGNQPISIDTNGQTVTFATAIQGAGTSLTLNDTTGNGTLILTAANTYTGTTTVNGGTLQIANGGGLLGTSCEYVGYSGTGSFTQSGGANNVNGGFNYLSLGLGYNAGSSGTYNLQRRRPFVGSTKRVRGLFRHGDLHAVRRNQHYHLQSRSRQQRRQQRNV